MKVFRGNSQGAMTERAHQYIKVAPILQGVTGVGVAQPVSRDVGIDTSPGRRCLNDAVQAVAV
jgi:hypothetical protein